GRFRRRRVRPAAWAGRSRAACPGRDRIRGLRLQPLAGLRLAGASRDRDPVGGLSRNRSAAAAGDPRAGGRPVAGSARGGDIGGAEVPVGGAASVQRLLDPVSFVAVDRHAAAGAGRAGLHPAGGGNPADPGAAGAATAGVEGADCYTATGFANPTRRVLAAVLHTRSEVRPLSAAPGASAAETG